MASAGHSWANYHWERSANPLPLSIGDNVDSTWDQHLIDANSDWNESEVLNNTIRPGQANPRRCNPDTGVVEICNRSYGNTGWLGIAGIWASGDHITKGYVKVNDTYFDTAKYDTDDWRQMVMCQEIGHVFGLGHQDEDFDNANLGTCMDYTSSPGGNTKPNTHDYGLLESMYAHLDAGDSWAEAPPIDEGGGNKGKKPPKKDRGVANFAPLSGGNSEWGRAIGQDGNGRDNEFVLNLGNGNSVITHVLWAN